jgi:hypothetical protein
MASLYICKKCLELKRENDHLKEENQSLKSKLKYQEKKHKEGYFGSSTPSSKVHLKAHSLVENQKKKGGAKIGHNGHGRKKETDDTADEVKTLSIEEICTVCQRELRSKEFRERTIIDSFPILAKSILYRCEKKWCPYCKKTYQAKPDVLPNSLYGNQLIAQAIVMHYEKGITVGKIETMMGKRVKSGSLFQLFHRIALMWEAVVPKLIEEYRQSHVKHADETGWRTDGANGYSWNFCTSDVSIFCFENTRSSKIPEKIFGTENLPGVLVVDRYNGYNKVPCKIQYCYAHLLRLVKALEDEFDESDEVKKFVDTLAPLLSDAMRLRNRSISNKMYYKEAEKLKRKILKVIRSSSTHSGIKDVQNVFYKNRKRLYHWVKDRKIPPENNYAERELRPTVIARKVSFGSQSIQGAKTRSILMTILHTAKKRLQNQTIENWFKEALSKIIQNPTINLYTLLPPVNPNKHQM